MNLPIPEISKEKSDTSPATPRRKKGRHKFTKDEDQKLISLVRQYGNSCWSFVAQNMSGLTPRQCRERYQDYLTPGIKNDVWTFEEEQLLKQKYDEFGPKWTTISKFFDSRTDVNIKNHWTILRQRLAKSLKIDGDRSAILHQSLNSISKNYNRATDNNNDNSVNIINGGNIHILDSLGNNFGYIKLPIIPPSLPTLVQQQSIMLTPSPIQTNNSNSNSPQNFAMNSVQHSPNFQQIQIISQAQPILSLPNSQTLNLIQQQNVQQQNIQQQNIQQQNIQQQNIQQHNMEQSPPNIANIQTFQNIQNLQHLQNIQNIQGAQQRGQVQSQDSSAPQQNSIPPLQLRPFAQIPLMQPLDFMLKKHLTSIDIPPLVQPMAKNKSSGKGNKSGKNGPFAGGNNSGNNNINSNNDPDKDIFETVSGSIDAIEIDTRPYDIKSAD